MLKTKRKILSLMLVLVLCIGPLQLFTLDASAASTVTLFTNGFEASEMHKNLSDAVEMSSNVSGYTSGINPECSIRTGERSHTGSAAIVYSGTDNSSATSFCYYRLYSNLEIAITPSTKLSYWFYPQQELGRHVAVDIICSDGTTLRDSGAVDQNGRNMHPGTGRGTVNTWNQVLCNIGQWLNGKVISEILVGYDYAPSTGKYRGYIDDLAITYQTNIGFSSSLEAGQQLPTWTDTYLSQTGNFTGYLPGTNPECGVTINEKAHTGTAALRYSGSITQTYYYNQCHFKVFDVPNFTVTDDSQLFYWVYAEDNIGVTIHVKVIFTDGTAAWYPPTDYDYESVGKWKLVQNSIGHNFFDNNAGKVVDMIDIEMYNDHTQGQFRGYIDDIIVTY